MDLREEIKQRDKFKQILFDLSESQNILATSGGRSEIYKRLEALYCPEAQSTKFRHFYSDIFIVLTQIQQGDKPGDINVLGENLALIRKGYQSQNPDKNGTFIDISESINKLFDHVSLDIARINYSDKADRERLTENSLDSVKSQLNEVSEKASSIQQKNEEMQGQLEKSQKEYITILGIFAAVVLAFTGGIAFSTSVLENIDAISIYRLLLTIDFLAFMLTAIIYILTKFIFILNGKDHNMFKFKWFNIAYSIIAAIVVIGWIFNAQSFSDFLANYLPWCK